MRELIDAFFRERSIVNHHIASFNDFLPTIDNPNSRMQRIVDNLRSSPEDERRGIIKLDEDRTEGDVIEIRIGRKRDDRGRIDLEAKPTITLGLPVVKEANGATHPLNPMEARLRNLNYTAPIYLDLRSSRTASSGSRSGCTSATSRSWSSRSDASSTRRT